MNAHQALRALGSWDKQRRHVQRWIKSLMARLKPWSVKISRRLERPTRVLLGALTGLVYGPMTAAAVGVLSALILGILKGPPALSELGPHLLSAMLGTVLSVGWTIGFLAVGIGLVVGTLNALEHGGSFAGLEWSLVAALGTAAGLGIGYADLAISALGLIGGGIVGGAVGLLTWLSCVDKHDRSDKAHPLIGYAIGTVVIGVYVYVFSGWTLTLWR